MTMQARQNQLKQAEIQGNKAKIVQGETESRKMTMQSKKQIQNQAQAGRSMVEMLGVLAIIAILSIGGIVGFRYAMNYYQANQIAHEMNMMRTDAKVKIAQGTEKLTLGEPYDPISESTLGHIQFNDAYPVDFACALADDETVELSNISCHVANAYYIELQNIPEGVCKPLAELVNGMNNIIAFNVNKNEYPEAGKCEAGNGNVLNAVFSAEAVSELKVCTGDTDCESENALYCDPSRHVCVRCYEDNQCAHNQYCENNTCVTCESGVWNGEECVECTDNDDCADKTDTPVCYTDTNTCVECLTYSDCKNEEKPQCDEASHTCKSCAEIDERTPVWGGTQCVECVNSTDCAETLVCKENTCSPCEAEEECQAKGTNYHCSKEDTCIQCLDNQVWDDESKDCVECTADNDCTDTPDTPVCYTEEYKCVECLTYENCTDTPETPQCDDESHTCKSCAEIDPNKPLWAETQCVECIENSDCLEKGTDKPICNKGSNTCEACPKNSFWDGEKCQEGCRENNHCAEDEYCHKLAGFSCTDEWENEEDFSGSCRKVNEDLIPGTVNGQIYYGSKNTMGWWSVKRFCEAANRLGYGNGQMAVWGNPDFKCNPSVTLSTSITPYCHKNGTDVRVGDFNDLSTTVEELREMFGVTHTGEWDTETIDIWLLDQQLTDCLMFEIEISTPQNSEGKKAGIILHANGATHRQYGNHALCQP